MGTTDEEFMRLAIVEAGRCVPEPGGLRPRVGAVVVRNGEILASAHRGELATGEHAEYTLLEGKLRSEILAGTTIYTTLEPCTTRNAPKLACVERIIDRKIARVVIGMLDPNPDISGKGQRRLRIASIATDLFPAHLMAQVEEQNREFIKGFPSPAVTSPPAIALATAISSASTPRSLTFVSEGQQATAPFILNTGLQIFKLSHAGQRHFCVWLLNAQGQRIELLANTTGVFAGSKAVHVNRAGPHLLDVAGDGAWSVSLVPNGPVAPSSPAELPRFLGTGLAFSPSQRSYHISNVGAEIFDLSLAAIPNIRYSVSPSTSLAHNGLLRIEVESPDASPLPELTVALSYTMASGTKAIQLFLLPADQRFAEAIP